MKLQDFIQTIKGNNPKEIVRGYFNKTMGLIFIKESTQEVFTYRGR